MVGMEDEVVVARGTKKALVISFYRASEIKGLICFDRLEDLVQGLGAKSFEVGKFRHGAESS